MSAQYDWVWETAEPHVLTEPCQVCGKPCTDRERLDRQAYAEVGSLCECCEDGYYEARENAAEHAADKHIDMAIVAERVPEGWDFGWVPLKGLETLYGTMLKHGLARHLWTMIGWPRIT